jgi:PDZ domain-containing secreted protein
MQVKIEAGTSFFLIPSENCKKTGANKPKEIRSIMWRQQQQKTWQLLPA